MSRIETRKRVSIERAAMLALAMGAGLLAPSVVPAPAHAAVIYCTSPGYPVGCVVRAAPAARAAVYCTSPGFPVGCVANPAARAVVRPGPGVNLGGPVNRPGLR